MRRTRRSISGSSMIETLERRCLLSAMPMMATTAAHVSNTPTDTDHDHDNDTSPLVSALSATPQVSASTMPANGDVNPYGVAFVPANVARGGTLVGGDVLVSNFNDSGNQQGTGTTIVQISPTGQQSTFFHGSAGLGLTTALGVLKRGFVLVGNVPTTDGTAATISGGSLLVLDRSGNQVLSIADPKLLDGPWDLTLVDQGSHAVVFVSNVLSGTVTRLSLSVPSHGTHVKVQSMTQIASGYLTRTDPAALVVGPTGLAFDHRHNLLYVASTGDNEVFSIKGALGTHKDNGKGTLVYQDAAHLRGPLGLVLAPNGDLIASNGDAVNADATQPSELVEFSPATGQFVAQRSVDSTGEGGAFGIAIQSSDDVAQFAAVDDITNALDVWTVNV